MPSTVADIGVTAYSEDLTQSVEIRKQLEERHIVQKDSSYGQGKAFDPTFDVQVRGRGDLPAIVIAGGATITGISGGVSMILNISFTEHAEDFPDWGFTMQNWPGATSS